MQKYIAFLRGINVGKIRIKMADLRAAFEKMGCQEVKTFLQSGNIVFNSEKKITELKSILEKGLTETFNYEAYVLLYKYETLADFIANYPMEKEEGWHNYVVFVEDDSTFEELKKIAEEAGEEKARIKMGDGVIYWKVKKGNSLSTPFSKFLAKKKYKSMTTVRNMNTLGKV